MSDQLLSKVCPVEVPAACAHRPLIGGRVIPWINVRLADGGVDFRAHHRRRLVACWRQRVCQVCGVALRHPLVLLGGPNQLRRLLFDEPPLHPECAMYAARACPMVAGQLTTYAQGPSVSEGRRGRRCPEPGCGCDGWTSSHSAQPERGGDPSSHPWFAVYVSDYLPAVNPDGELQGGACLPEHLLRVRLLTIPGQGWVGRSVPLAEVIAGYEPAGQLVGGDRDG